jgi:hypothetical protein
MVREHERFLHNVPLLAQTEVDRNQTVAVEAYWVVDLFCVDSGRAVN